VQGTIFNEYEQSLWLVGARPVLILDQSDRKYREQSVVRVFSFQVELKNPVHIQLLFG